MKASRLALFFAGVASLTATSNRNLSVAQTERQTPRSNKEQNSVTKNNSRTDLTRANVTQLPLFFEANQGQTDPRVRFLSRSGAYTLFLTSSQAVLRLRAREKQNANEAVLRMKLLGANENATARGLDELPGKANYLIGNDLEKWHTDVSTNGKVKYGDIYPGSISSTTAPKGGWSTILRCIRALIQVLFTLPSTAQPHASIDPAICFFELQTAKCASASLSRISSQTVQRLPPGAW
jgi:hypothetical protein